MSKGGIVLTVIISVIVIVLIIGGLYFGATPHGRETWNNWFHAVQKVDDATRYSTRKQVEDSCRTMIASYTSDKMTYEQYVGSENTEKQSWAEQAKMRANKTAATYNEYVLKNSYVWEGNVPGDILAQLEYLK